MYDLIIVGGGPAGLTAAIYASRANLKVLILEKGAPGGKIFLTHKIENYPGIDSISGRELADQMYQHALKFGAEFKQEMVEKIENFPEEKIVYTTNNEYHAKTILLATGTENKKLSIKGEEEFLGRGVSYCAVCDGNFFRNLDVAVIGGGNSAIEEALYLADICNSVTIVHRREEFRAESFALEKAKTHPKIKFELNAVLKEIIGDNVVRQIEIENVQTKEKKQLDVRGVFIYVGLKPMVSNFLNFNFFDENKNIVVDKNMKTSIEGIYSAGDVNAKSLRQITTAVSDGAQAGQAIINYLKQK